MLREGLEVDAALRWQVHRLVVGFGLDIAVGRWGRLPGREGAAWPAQGVQEGGQQNKDNGTNSQLGTRGLGFVFAVHVVWGRVHGDRGMRMRLRGDALRDGGDRVILATG